MPTITINRKVVDRLIGKKLPEEKLKDRIAMIGTDIASMTAEEIIVEIFPNRPDMLSERGFSRALSAFVGVNPGLKTYSVKPSGHKVIIDKSMRDVRPYTACAIVKNLKLDNDTIKEIIEIQEKLHITFCRNRKKAAIGIYPLEKITPPIQFTSRAPEDILFRPLEWPGELRGDEILKQHPKGREYAHLVKGLARYAIFADSKNNILSLTPIINSHLTGKITEATKEAFVEVSGFNFGTCNMVLNILVTTLADMGADIYSMELDYPDKKIVTPDLKPVEMKLDIAYVNKHLGLDLKEADAKKLLGLMGHGYAHGKVLVPAYRADVLHPVDLVEDIGIAYGFENLTPEIPRVATIAEEDPFYKFTVKVGNILAGLGLLEASTYHLSNKQVQSEKVVHHTDAIELADTKSGDYDVLRHWIVPNLLQVLSENKHNEYPQRLFETGRVFRRSDTTDTGIAEPSMLALVSCHKDADFTQAKQYLDYLFRCLGLGYEIKETVHETFIPGRVGTIIVGKREIGFIGEVSPQVLTNFSLELPVAALEMDLDALFEMVQENLAR